MRVIKNRGMGRILGRRILKSCRADDWTEGTVQPPDVKGYRRTSIMDLNVFIDVRACHHASGDPCRWESGHGVLERIKAHRNSMVVFPGAPPSDSIFTRTIIFTNDVVFSDIKKSQTYIF